MAETGIFISHKHEDVATAKFLSNALDDAGRPHLKAHISPHIQAGGRWHDWITANLRDANLFLLLFTDPTLNWDWCMYEAGVFAGRNDNRNLFCIHEPHSTPPSPLQSRQNVPATREAIAEFLHTLFRTKDYLRLDHAIRPDVPQEWIDSTATRLASDITGKAETQVLFRRLVIEVKGTNELAENRIPKDARIVDPDVRDLSLFHKDKGEWTWGELIDDVMNATDQQWINDLGIVFPTVVKRKQPPPIQSVYRPSGTSDERYRPLVYQLDRRGDKLLRFYVAFTEEPRWDRDVITRPVASFKALMVELQELIEAANPDDDVKMLAYTPAVGYLARSPDEWEKLRSAMVAHADRLRITCLNRKALADWHDQFVQRRTDRAEILDATLTKQATDVSEELLAEFAHVTRVGWRELPEYYLFSNGTRSIIVTPFFLPNLDDPLDEARRKNLPNVSMFGLVSNDRKIWSQVNRIQDFYHVQRSRSSGGTVLGV